MATAPPNTLGGKPLQDPKLLRKVCLDRGLPTDNWYGRVNVFRVPLKGHGTGAVLMKKADLDALGAGSAYGYGRLSAFDLKLSDGRNDPITLKHVYVVGVCECLTPGREADPAAYYLVPLGDFRHPNANNNYSSFFYGDSPTASTSSYTWVNWLRDDGSAYLHETTAASGGATPWTWAQLGAGVWPYGAVTAWPGLPFTPDGTPENFDLTGLSRADALAHVLDRLACAAKYDPTAHAFSVVRLGDADAAADAAVERLRPHLVWATHPTDPVTPVTRFVAFLKFPPHLPAQDSLNYPGGRGPWGRVEVGGGGAGGVSGTGYWAVHLHDDLGLRYGNPSGFTFGTLDNAAAVASRQAERAADYERKARYFDHPRTLVWKGLRVEALTTCLGKRWGAVAFYDRGDGWKTELAAWPDGSLENWKPRRPPPQPPPVESWACEGNRAGATLSAVTLGAGWTRVSGVVRVPTDRTSRYRVRAYFKGTVASPNPGSVSLKISVAICDSGGTILTPSASPNEYTLTVTNGAGDRYLDAAEYEYLFVSSAPVYFCVAADLSGTAGGTGTAGGQIFLDRVHARANTDTLL